MLTRARTWYSHHAAALAAAGLWAAGLGLAVANAWQLNSSAASTSDETTETSGTTSTEAVSDSEESTTGDKASEAPAVFLPEDTIVAHKDSTSLPATGAAQMQKPTG
jgi:hypothetical protein